MINLVSDDEVEESDDEVTNEELEEVRGDERVSGWEGTDDEEESDCDDEEESDCDDEEESDCDDEEESDCDEEECDEVEGTRKRKRAAERRFSKDAEDDGNDASVIDHVILYSLFVNHKQYAYSPYSPFQRSSMSV